MDLNLTFKVKEGSMDRVYLLEMLLSDIPDTFQSDVFQTMQSYTEGGGKKIWPAVDMAFNYLQPICKFKTIAQKFKNLIKVS